MADEQARPNEPAPPRKNNRTVFIVLLVLLLIAIQVYLYLKYTQRNTENQKLTEQVNADSVRIADLGMKYQEALANVESYKGQNAQLDSIIAVKEKTLLDMKNNYNSLQKEKKLSEAEYNKQINGLNGIVSDLQNQIEVLNKQLNVQISRNDSLGKSLATQMNANAELSSTNEAQAKKLSIASLLKPTSINATGTRAKSSGKEEETNNAKKAEKLKVCFDIPANAVADAGEKTFYIRLVSPEGVTLNVESAGSGVIKKADSGDMIQYTTSTTIDYNQQATNSCAYWQQAAPYTKGTYTAEIYQDGYLIGTQKFELK